MQRITFEKLYFRLLDKEVSTVCKTVDNSIVDFTNDDPGKPCIFPFTYLGVTHSECTVANNGRNGGNLWCATEVDENGNVVDYKWGTCGANCIPGIIDSNDKSLIFLHTDSLFPFQHLLIICF